MYSSRGSNAYGQPGQQPPPYAAQSAYRQNLGPAYSGGSVGGQDGASQLSMASRHSSILGGGGGGPNEADVSGGYRVHSSAAAHYGGQYSSVYGSAALSSSQQVPTAGDKGSVPAALEGRRVYSSAMPESPKFISGDYVSSSSHGYGQKGDQLFADKISDYPSIDRRQYGARSSAYIGREQNEPTGRYVDSLGFSHQHQPDLYDRIDQASVLRQEQMLKAQSLQSNSLVGGSRQADYLATRGAAIRLPAEDLMSYGGRMDVDPHSLSLLSGSSHGGQHAPSILGAAPRRNIDDLVYAQSSSNPGYGVSLPPGRDYATGKGLHGASLELDYPGSSLLSRGSLPRIDDRKHERSGYAQELERREEERRRDHLLEREKDRERDKEREREHERERERERQRRREKERDRELKRGSEIRHERTPPRISRDRRGSSLSKERRSLRRESPRHEVLHRHHSPVKEKRRDYVCKVYSSSLVDVERDYLSIDKRYPRLFITPECSKVVVNWPRENLKLSIHTPVSFEHDFVEEETTDEQNVPTPKPLDDEPLQSERGLTVWNAKMILMSGLSQNALEELSSERSYDDRIPHFCNMLRFAILKKENALMAIGGPWDMVDGQNPSVDDSSLVRTVMRYAKSTGLDLKNCRQWNRFLEIHYDRTGKDGLFSHKEVSVLYVPDLSECLPSLETWRDQWLTHKKAIAERERQLALKKEKPREKKEGGLKDNPGSVKDLKSDDKSEKKKASESSGQAVDINKQEKDGSKPKGTTSEKVGGENSKKIQKIDAVEIEEGKSLEKKEQEEGPVQTSGGVKSGKKRIIKKKIVKQKIADKKTVVENTTKQNDKLEEKDVEEKSANSEVTGQLDVASSNPAAVKTFIRKKVAKKVQVTKTAEKEDEVVQPEVKPVKEPEGSEDKSKGKSDSSNATGVQGASVKTTVKKKIIKRVPKRKVSPLESNDGTTDSTKDGDKDGNKLAQSENEQTKDASNQGKEVESENKVAPKTKLKQASEKLDNVDSLSKKVNKTVNEIEKEDKKAKENRGIGPKKETGDDKQKVIQKDGQDGRGEKSREREKSKDEKERKDRDGKDETRSKSNREVKEKKKPDEPPRHPGLFIQTKGSKNSKLRSLSLSLDSLLDYSDKDIEESTFELSIFAETLYEMLQYQMGCRLLTFLQKLRSKFVTKRNKRKRQREESAKESELVSPVKRVKNEEKPTVEVKSIETGDESQPDPGKTAVKESGSSVDEAVKVKPENETDEDEDPEEDPEEDEEMPDRSPQHDSTNKEKDADMNIDTDAKSEKVTGDEKDEQLETAKETSDMKSKLEAECKPEVEKAETKKKETKVVVDKELLQAFRFFDRNRVGYIRVEDLRLIIHNLGMFLSHRDVKELVQSALLESNTGRNDQILYKKLVRMPGI